MRRMASSDRHRLATQMQGKDRDLLAAFLLDNGTGVGLNPFPSTTAGAARQNCAGLAFEYPILGVQSAGLTCLLKALTALPPATRLTRRILRSASHTCIVLMREDGACVGAYLYAKAGVPLPVFACPTTGSTPRKSRGRQSTARRQLTAQQLDLFVDVA
ncbi:hypothetical protein LNAOJCKE_5635 [Methylorubrum aminovorans]|uniref:Uncharacterized protein n=2 Tax=Methylorubrum aminovorans TaxID=269069 RepID=A0ABQ4UNJ4_9HYPH|nr:hypothetical protein LNAOJCKE_5635 [Methylorubrum aminovorans]